MAYVKVGSDRIQLDSHGYLKIPEQWNGPVAKKLAEQSKVVLTDDHWNLINFVRDHWVKYGSIIQVRKLCKETGIGLAKIYALFPDGPNKGLCRIAGLPRPPGCI